MKELTNKQKCLKMWEWLAENPDQSKEDYIEIYDQSSTVCDYWYCYACLETKRANKKDNECESCPINWGTRFTDLKCLVYHSPYLNWEKSKMLKTRTKYALQMVELIKSTWKE
jgi:hypothetical protein